MVRKVERSEIRLRRTNIIVGIDEVGRGPLAGPITVAALATRKNAKTARVLIGIKDSKKLSPMRREEWFHTITQNKIFSFAVVSVSSRVIDLKGISHAARLAISKCLKKLSSSLRAHIMLDGGLYAPEEYRQKTIIKGDEKVPLIAASSIIAKVTRDRYMVRMDKKYPKYGFDKHKGYGTRAHFAAIKKHGLSKIHRKSFCTKLV